MQQICDVESQRFGAESPGFVRRTQRIGPVIVPSGTLYIRHRTARKEKQLRALSLVAGDIHINPT